MWDRVFLEQTPGAALDDEGKKCLGAALPQRQGGDSNDPREDSETGNNGQGLGLMRNYVTDPFVSGLSSATCLSFAPSLSAAAHAFYPVSWSNIRSTKSMQTSITEEELNYYFPSKGIGWMVKYELQL